jgi:VanZ family protein
VFYASFAFFVARSFSSQSRWLIIRSKFVVYSIIFTFLYGVSDEIHQYFVPGRVFSIFDILANGLGAIAGTLVFYYRKRLISKSK